MFSYLEKKDAAAWQCAEGFKTCCNGNLLEKFVVEKIWSPIVWKDGKRCGENFLYSDLCVLDFDDQGDEAMGDIARSLADTAHLIATTKSHLIEKPGHGTCERFRLVVPWERRIEDKETYIFNMKQIHRRYHWADKSCLDASRWFYPCKEIFSIVRGAECFRQEVKELPVGCQEKTLGSNPRKSLPNWLLGFINSGHIAQGTSRHWKLFAAAYELACFGWDDARIFTTLRNAPINWDGISEADLKQRIANARRKHDKANTQ